MKVLWLCNVVLPVIARQLGIEGSNKEGWISGLAEAVLNGRRENDIVLSVAFPLSGNRSLKNGGEREILREVIRMGEGKASFVCYGFPEDVGNAEIYDEAIEAELQRILEMAEPDVVHCFGTEYPHTLAMCKIFPHKERLLVGVQGICTLIAESYFADLPGSVVEAGTFRDYLKKDTLKRQQEKFARRGSTEREILSLAGNITGRSRWDRAFAEKCSPGARYYVMNETLRPEFYGPVWEEGKCIPYSIFLSQGDYPLKGLHYMLLAMPAILEKYPEAKVYVAGNSLVEYRTLKQKLKISAYGRYLRKLLLGNGLEDKVVFLGRLDAGQMLDRYLESSLFVCCSSLENSPNSLGEAMLLGMPCVSADVGGIPSLFMDGMDGILYKGFSLPGGENAWEGAAASDIDADGTERTAGKRTEAGGTERTAGMQAEAGGLEAVARRLAEAVLEMWGNPEQRKEYCQNARRHALETHNQDKNCRRLMEIYEDIDKASRTLSQQA